MSQSDDILYGEPGSFASEMKRLVNNKEMGDIKFVVGTSRKSVYAHRCILAARCEVFRAMFAESHKNGKAETGEIPFVLSDTTPDIFLALLEFIYTNSVTLNHKIVVDVLGSSIEYGLDGLRELCVEFLQRNLAVNTACEALQAAVTYGQDDLRVPALRYIEQNTPKVFACKGFQELSDVALDVILQSNELTIDELDVLRAVTEWANVNAVVLSRSVEQVARRVSPHIRLPLLGPEELKVVEEGNTNKLLSVEQISHAWRCHALGRADADSPLTKSRKGTRPRDSQKGMGNL